jgi:MFS family permease
MCPAKTEGEHRSVTDDQEPHNAADVAELTPDADNGLDNLETREADVVEPTAEVVRHGGTFESFRYRAYALFWSGALVSNAGSWMQTYALGIVVYAFRRSSFDLGLVNFFSQIPVLFLALPAGLLADRVSKRKLIIWAQVILLVQAAALGYLYTTGHLSSRTPVTSLVWVAALGLVGGVMSALTFPAWQSFLPELVPRKSLLNAIALNSAQFQSSRLLGPLIAGALVVAGAGMGQIFYVNAASFLFVIAALWAMRPPTPAELGYPPGGPGPSGRPAKAGAQREGSMKTLLAGLQYARQNSAVGWLIVTTAVLTVFGFPYMTLLPAIVNRTLGLAEGGDAYKHAVAYIMAANGLGAMVGALVVASLPATTKRERLIPFTLVGFAVALIGFALSRSLVVTILFSTVAGMAILATNSLSNTSIQSAVPGHLRGRVMALFIMSFMGIMPISGLLFGWIGGLIGPSNAVLVGAIALGAWALLLVFRRSMITPEEPSEVAAANIA